MTEKIIKPDQLCVGIYVHLNMSWMDHSFAKNSFKIENESQLAKIKTLGLSEITYDVELSDVKPLSLEPKTVDEEQSEVKVEQEQGQDARAKTVKERRSRLNRCEKAYKDTVSAVRNMMLHPRAAVEQADGMVSGMVGGLMKDQETTVHLVNMKGKNEGAYYHAINVTILALMLGRQLGLSKEEMRCLGIGTMLRDLGYSEVPSKITCKKGPLTKPEQDFVNMHPVYGMRIAERMGKLPADALVIIEQHHEMHDGSGFPKGLKGDQISRLAQVVAIANDYDNLCNTKDPANARTPHEAISLMFAKDKKKYNAEILTVFITNMGVYPPGTVVKLSNDRFAVVMSINILSLLQPKVMVYDASIPKDEAAIIDLSEEDLGISGSIRVNSLPEEVCDYLNVGTSVNVFMDPVPEKK